MPTEQSTDFDPQAAADRHRSLVALAADTASDDIQAVLNLGAAVLVHGSLERLHLQRVLQLVDPSVLRELEQEHQRLEEHLDLLRELQQSEPGAEDVTILAAALLERLRQHIDRDERTLYRPMARLLGADGADGSGAGR